MMEIQYLMMDDQMLEHKMLGLSVKEVILLIKIHVQKFEVMAS